MVVLALAAAGLLGSCAGDRATLGARRPTSKSTTTTSVTPPSADKVAVTNEPNAPTSTTITAPPTNLAPPALGPNDLLGYIATPTGSPQVRVLPDDSAPKIDVPSKTSAGAPTTFAVVGDAAPGANSKHPGWYQVELPARPNGATGYVAAGSVAVTRTPMRLFIDLGARTLHVENDGKTVFSTTVAVGTTKNPTPTGGSYVTELIANVKPTGSYGPYAFGLALHSDTLTEFAGGPGQVGIHGTNKPNLIGQRVSHGCVRLNNDAINQLVDLDLPLGVPVFIT